MILKVLVGPGSHGFYKAWTTRRCDINHRIHAESFQMFRDIWLHDNAADDSPLPWRLTKPQVILPVLDARSDGALVLVSLRRKIVVTVHFGSSQTGCGRQRGN